eukprot:GILK01007248.1.p1 GENE.GILK01007248.1~~GILK01007248.1.p1  ORF type:complete len:184 (+),score=16.89 GILK01007248.1:65-616(+)
MSLKGWVSRELLKMRYPEGHAMRLFQPLVPFPLKKIAEESDEARQRAMIMAAIGSNCQDEQVRDKFVEELMQRLRVESSAQRTTDQVSTSEESDMQDSQGSMSAREELEYTSLYMQECLQSVGLSAADIHTLCSLFCELIHEESLQWQVQIKSFLRDRHLGDDSVSKVISSLGVLAVQQHTSC